MSCRVARIEKHQLLDIITEGYKAGIGPSAIARITGYSLRQIHNYARSMNLHMLTTRPTLPEQPPVGLLIALAKAGIAASRLGYTCAPVTPQ